MNTALEGNVNAEVADSKFDISNDPFDEPLGEQLVLNDTYFAAARNSVTVDGMDFSFMKPPYMNFDDHILTKGKLQEAYRQREFLLLYGYSGCGKTTVLKQFHEKYPDYIQHPGFHFPWSGSNACKNGKLYRSPAQAAHIRNRNSAGTVRLYERNHVSF